MIVVEELSLTVGSFSLQDISFSLQAGEYGILMGRTGSGKTTLLESLCGLKPLDSGRIIIDGEDVTSLKPGARGIGFVPQEGALFHRMSVRDQIGFALEIRRQSASTIASRVKTLAELLGIVDLLDRGPEGLSGGEHIVPCSEHFEAYCHFFVVQPLILIFNSRNPHEVSPGTGGERLQIGSFIGRQPDGSLVLWS